MLIRKRIGQGCYVCSYRCVDTDIMILVSNKSILLNFARLVDGTYTVRRMRSADLLHRNQISLSINNPASPQGKFPHTASSNTNSCLSSHFIIKVKEQTTSIKFGASYLFDEYWNIFSSKLFCYKKVLIHFILVDGMSAFSISNLFTISPTPYSSASCFCHISLSQGLLIRLQ